MALRALMVTVISEAKEAGLNRTKQWYSSNQQLVEQWRSSLDIYQSLLPQPVFEHIVGLGNVHSWQSGYTIVIAGFILYLFIQHVLSMFARISFRHKWS